MKSSIKRNQNEENQDGKPSGKKKQNEIFKRKHLVFRKENNVLTEMFK